MPRPRGVTSHDVARRAGVSRPIVSGVLNGTMSTMRVSAETRQRVLAAAQDLGYSPHPLARALRCQRTNVLGIIPRSYRRTPYEHPVPFLLGVQIASAAMQRGYHVVEASPETVRTQESDAVAQFLLERRVDGVILDSPDTPDEVERFVDLGLPVVQVIRPQSGVATPSVIVDATPGLRAALQYLVERGHEQIAYIGHGGAHPVDRDRRECFVSSLADHRLPVRDEWIQLVADYGIEEGLAAANALIAQPEWPTALLVAGDNLALGVLQALHHARIRVPDALSLVSYDDIFAAHLAPPLTSVAQPLHDVATRAVSLLLSQLDDSDRVSQEPSNVVLPTTLTIRGSVGLPRASVLAKQDGAAASAR